MVSRPRAKRKPDYEFEAIARSHFHIRRSETFWVDYCALRCLEPLALTYEDHVADPSGYLRPLADWAGVPVPGNPAYTQEIQRDADSEAWRRRFLEEARDAELLDAAVPSPMARSPLYRLQRKARFVRPGKVPYAW